MTIDFKAEVEKRKEALLADLFSLLEINSERDDSKADKEHPFGPGPVKALHKFLEIAERDGYPTQNVDNYAGHFTFGEGEEERRRLRMVVFMPVVLVMIKDQLWHVTMD